MTDNPSPATTAPAVISEVPANGTDSPRGDYLPTVDPPAGLEPV